MVAVALAHFLALIGILGFAMTTGRLDDEKAQQYLATWRGEKLVPPPPVVEVVEQKESPQQAENRIAETEKKREKISREVQLYLELLESMQGTVQTARDTLEKDRKKLRQQQKLFAAKLKEHNEKISNESFRKTLAKYSAIKASSVKDDFMHMEQDDVVRYLTAMKPDVATAILQKFRTPEEQTRRRDLIKKMEQFGVIDVAKK